MHQLIFGLLRWVEAIIMTFHKANSLSSWPAKRIFLFLLTIFQALGV